MATTIIGNVNHPARTDHRSCCGVLVSETMSCGQLAALQEGKLRQVGEGDYEVIP